ANSTLTKSTKKKKKETRHCPIPKYKINHMAGDNSANEAIDPPLPDRLNTFYPQAVRYATVAALSLKSYNSLRLCKQSNFSSTDQKKSRRHDPCDFSGSQYNRRLCPTTAD
ncbi:hypothetical protein SK355_08760, partial [Candidatus Fukatsuia symbiotica]|nr:hypothetical protein [Candidatus Fukatsuia symbiotica]